MLALNRIENLQQQLRLNSPRNHALLVTNPANIFYLCGFSGSAAALLIFDDRAIFFSDGRYKTQAAAEVTGARILIATKAPITAAAGWLATSNQRSRNRAKLSIAIEADYMTVAARSRLSRTLGARFQLRPTPPLIEKARMTKSRDEIRKIRAAASLGSSLFATVVKAIRPGVKEITVAAKLEFAARKAGSNAMSFSTIIAAGERSALPHGQASAAAIPRRGFVVCDFGVILASYCSDMTRTVHVGRPDGEARHAYEAVLSAQQAGIEAVKPGATAGEVDSVVRKVLRKSGLAKYFTHSTGHGVGLEIHEAPRLATGQTEELLPGMVVTIEPGVYIAGKWGIRIEDMVLVTQTGSEILTPASKELIVI